METFQLSQPRLKCGEVFIWDCVGEIFAIECQLCEERPLCTLTEFTEHMDVWHYDWTAEAYATLPDMPDTTTITNDENSQMYWPTESEPMYASSLTPTERTDSLSGGDDDEYESEYFDDAAAKTVEQMEMEIDGSVENGSSSPQTNIVYQCETSATKPSPTYDAAASSSVPIADDRILDATIDATNNFPSTSDDNTILCMSAAEQNVDEENEANNMQESATSFTVHKKVENPALKSLKTQKLIEIYEKFPELWHKQRNPMDTAAQTKAYRSISRELTQQGIKLKASTVQRRIHGLRKRYRFEKFQELKNILEGQPYESTFEFYDQLQFLKHHIAPQLCKICNRICKDAAECCTRQLVTTASVEQDVCDSELTESADEEKSTQCTETEQMNENEETSSNIAEAIVEMQCHSDVTRLTTMTVPIEVTTANNGSLKCIHGPDCDSNQFENPPNLVSMPESMIGVTHFHVPAYESNELGNPTTIVDGVAYSFQPGFGYLENAPMAIQASFVQNRVQVNDPQEKTFHQLGAPEFEPQISPFFQHVVPFNDSPNGFVQQSDTCVGPQEALLVQHYVQETQSQEIPLSQHSFPEDAPQSTNLYTLPETEPQKELIPFEKKDKVEILEILELPKVNNFKAQEHEVSTSTVDGNLSKNIADDHSAMEEYESSNGDSGVLRDLDEQCNDGLDPKKGPKIKRHPTFARLSTDQARKLIKIYEKYPILWNPKNIDYSTRERRRKAWNQITTQVNEICKTRYTWTTVHRKMHDYMKYYRRERQRIEAEGGQTRWFFYDDFTFLNEVIDEESKDIPKILQSKILNQKIIEMYTKYPQLWDTTHDEFKRRNIRKGLFKEMSEKLLSTHNIHITGLKLQQRIVEFRCTYRMEKERRCSAERRGESYTPRYDYYEQLQFLDAHTSPFFCDKCDAQFTKFGERSRHMQKEHGPKKNLGEPLPQPPPPSIFAKKVAALDNVCHICGNGFTLRRTLLSHLKRHNTQPTRVCSLCPKRFFDTHTLQIHERSHTKSRPFICEQCGASYASGSKLNQHLKRHNNQRDHPCVVCHKAFYSAFECDRHMRTHVNVREKVCPVCGKDFAVGSSYYAHMLLHEDVKRYNCVDCSLKFAQFAGLYKHRKRYHPTEFALDKETRLGKMLRKQQEAQVEEEF
ncbi:uncharacterized protein [Eurosta solidaginis]|uniref:uncharacterized protein isoform X2 n=1 Tax=Eurosta solidaginis TaxID=178769 RepID=UPI00353136AF